MADKAVASLKSIHGKVFQVGRLQDFFCAYFKKCLYAVVCTRLHALWISALYLYLPWYYFRVTQYISTEYSHNYL